MPRTITKTVYSFRELLDLHEQGTVTANAVDKARDWLRESYTYQDWWDYLYDLWTSALDQIGFENAVIAFSGFGNQGDGASFTANVNVAKLTRFMATEYEPTDTISASEDEGGRDFRGWLVKQIGGKNTNTRYLKLGLVANYIDAKVKRISHRYSHENTCEFQADFRDTGEVGAGPDYQWASDQPRLRALFEQWVQDTENLRVDLCKAIYRSLEEEYEYLTSDDNLIELSEANDYTFDESGHREG